MSLDKPAVMKIARLARLRLAEADIAPLARDMNEILDWVEQLAQVDTDNIAPMTSAAAVNAPRRADRVDDGGYAEKILANAPAAAQGFFRVPKVVE